MYYIQEKIKLLYVLMMDASLGILWCLCLLVNLHPRSELDALAESQIACWCPVNMLFSYLHNGRNQMKLV